MIMMIHDDNNDDDYDDVDHGDDDDDDDDDDIDNMIITILDSMWYMFFLLYLTWHRLMELEIVTQRGHHHVFGNWSSVLRHQPRSPSQERTYDQRSHRDL